MEGEKKEIEKGQKDIIENDRYSQVGVDDLNIELKVGKIRI